MYNDFLHLLLFRRSRVKHGRASEEDDVISPQKKKPKMKNAKPVKPVQLPSPEQDSNDEDDGSDWTKRFNGLWQFQEPSILTEKAFNLVMSFGKSQCCICALFVSPSPFVVYEHKKLRSSIKCLSARETSKKRYGLAGLKVHVQLA